MLLFVALCSCLLRSPDGSWRRSWRILQNFHRAAKTKLYHWPHVCQRHMRSWDIRRPWLALAYGNEITSSPRSLSQWIKEYALGFAPLTQVSNWSHQQEAVAWPWQQTVLVFRRQHMRRELGNCSLNFQSFTPLQMPNKPAPPLIPAHFAERVHQQVGLAESWNSLSFTEVWDSNLILSALECCLYGFSCILCNIQVWRNSRTCHNFTSEELGSQRIWVLTSIRHPEKYGNYATPSWIVQSKLT